ncbi:hypothetical protein K9N50_08040 [bacterium]|nr:hypothetical protein [bacterium]
MKYFIISIFVLFLVIGLFGSDTQTFFIYDDDQIHQPPADLASIPLTTLVDTVTVIAYAGAVWGEHDLSNRDYCLAWSVESSCDFDEWLENQGYRRKTDYD